MGEKCLATSAKANGVSASRVWKTLGWPGTSAPPKVGSKKVFLREAPGNQFIGIARSGPAEKALRDAIFDFVGIGESLILVETDETAEIVHAIHVVVGDLRFDHMFPLGIAAVPNALEHRKPNINRKLFGVAK